MARDAQSAKIEIDAQRCKSCGLCIEACKHGCLGFGAHANRAGYAPAQIIAPERCVGCGVCILTCPEPRCINAASPAAGGENA